MKPGRNDPCPCGSGKKYKHCCLDTESSQQEPGNLAWLRLRRLLDQHNRDMLRFVTDAYGRVAFEEAWRQFVSDGETVFDPESLHIPLFMPWFYHRWSSDPEQSQVRDAGLRGVIPTAEYLRRKTRLDPLLREYLESCLAAPFSAFEILHADPGRRLLMKDLLTGAEHDVAERSASAQMEEGDLIFGQVASADAVTLLEASQAFAVPPIWKIEIVEFRVRHFKGAISVAPERLRRAESAVLELYRHIAERLLERRLPALQNTDGDPLSLRSVVFNVSSPQEAFDALKHLALGDSDDDLRREAALEVDGSLKRVRFSWLKRGNARNRTWDNTVLGSVEIDGTRLFVEVNSGKRERVLRGIVAKALGERARYRATEIQSLEKLLTEHRAPARAAEDSASLVELPEVKAKIGEMMARYYEQWVNDSIPALGGRTPLEAVKDPAGREAVEALLRQIERDGSRMTPPLEPRIIQQLRERLRLT